MNSKAIAPLEKRQALVDKPFELDRPDLGAVLLALRPALHVLVVVEVALDPLDLAMEEVDEGPEQVGQVVLETGLAERLSEDVEDVRLSAPSQASASGSGPVIRLVLVRAGAHRAPVRRADRRWRTAPDRRDRGGLRGSGCR